jgi:2,4-dienoyl-CoA reductase-like NADH-dependent reductase (Old Yellow Enzyme family)
MAPMTRSFAVAGIPGADVADYYRRRAENNVGLILTKTAAIARPAARNDPNAPFFHGAEALSGWKHVVDSAHAPGGKIAPQLTHQGACPPLRSDWKPDAAPESPSGLIAPGQLYGEAMSDEAIADTIAAFAKAAADAKRLGFDLIEIQGSGGYLIDQFLGRIERPDRSLWRCNDRRTRAFWGRGGSRDQICSR